MGLCLGIGLFIGAQGAVPPLLIDSFTDADATSLASHLSDSGDAWAIVSGGFVVQSNTVTRSVGSTSVAVIDTAVSDFKASVDITVQSGGQGLVFRYIDATHFWFAWIDFASQELRLYKVNPTNSVVASRAITVTAGQTYKLSVHAVGSDIFATIDGAYPLQWTDSFNSSATKVGIRSGSAATFDNFTVFNGSLPFAIIESVTASNADTPQVTPTPDGSGEVVHPDVVKVPTWNGYEYWMAITGYTGRDSAKENPQILASHDGDSWVVPAGLTNPIEPNPGADDYNYDPDIVMGPDGKMYVFYGQVIDGVSSHYVRESSDGVDWSTRTKILDGDIKSASIVYRNGVWTMWHIGPSGIGYERIVKRTAVAATGPWSAPVQCKIYSNVGGLFSNPPSDKVIWHLNVIAISDGSYRVVYSVYDSGNLSTNKLHWGGSYDGVLFFMDAAPFLQAGSAGQWDNLQLYRSAFLQRSDGDYDLWYSGMSNTTPVVAKIGRSIIRA